MKIFSGIVFLLWMGKIFAQDQVLQADICIYGGTSAGVIAAYTASKAGKSVILLEPSNRLGGLSSGGLGQTDIGNKYVVKGLALDFYRKVGKHYNTFEQWIFEPKVADSIFREYLATCDAKGMMNYRLIGVEKEDKNIRKVHLVSTKEGSKSKISVQAKIFMDCTYEGDLLAMAGASYHVGREGNSVYGETLNGVQLMTGHQFPDGIDPYVIKGDPKSGFLWGIQDGQLLPDGTGDKKVQAYNFRITLTNVKSNSIPITKPENYDPARYELLRRQKEIDPWKNLEDIFIWSLMPNGKTDINNRNGFSTDMIGMNWDYPEADYEARKLIIKEHEDYTKGLLYFVGHDASVPQFIRDEMKQWGYPKDEFLDNGHWSPQLYIREARRLIGDLVMTQHHCEGGETVDDIIGYAAYQMDSHNCDRLIVNGMVKNEGNVEVRVPEPFPISYRAIVPRKKEVSNLIVPVCLSASHIAFGSIRMEPVFMVLAQSGALAACQAIDKNIVVQDIDVGMVQREFLKNPKADGRSIDELIHVMDTSQVTLIGNWRKGSRKGFGKSFMETNTGGNKAIFETSSGFKPGRYKLYTYYPKSKDSSQKYTVRVFDGNEIKEKVLDLSKVEIIGQTTSTWVEVGEYLFDASSKRPYIEIDTQIAEGVVAANAMLLIPSTDQN